MTAIEAAYVAADGKRVMSMLAFSRTIDTRPRPSEPRGRRDLAAGACMPG